MIYRAFGPFIGLCAGLPLCLMPASAEETAAADSVSAGSEASEASEERLTRFDYVVLAGLADSGDVLNLSAYRFQNHGRLQRPGRARGRNRSGEGSG